MSDFGEFGVLEETYSKRALDRNKLDEKTRELKELFSSEFGFKEECPISGCNYSVFSSFVWKNYFVEWVIYTQRNGFKHPLEQISSKSELTYINCSECGDSVCFSLPFFCTRYLS